MADRKNSAVAISTQAKALDGIRAVCRDVKDLLSRQRGFHRPLELPRRNRRQNSIRIDPELAAEPAPPPAPPPEPPPPWANAVDENAMQARATNRGLRIMDASP